MSLFSSISFHFSSLLNFQGDEIVHNADELFFTASTLKVPLLTAMYRKIDRGELDPDRRIKLTDRMRVPGSGVLKTLDEGLEPTLHDLAMLMIIISDNTATDIIYDLVGRDEIFRLLAELGLGSTRIPMTTRELLYSVVGLDPTNPNHTFRSASDRLFYQEYVDDADAFSLDNSDVSSPDGPYTMAIMAKEVTDGRLETD